MVHHFGEQNNEIIITTRNKYHAISKIANSLDSSQKEILLFIHSFSGCDTTSSIYGFGKEAILKRAAKIYEEGYLSLLLSVREPIDAIVDAGIILFQHIYGNRTEELETLRFQCYSRMVATKKKLNPSRLPPTKSAATQHILRSYLQYHNWVTLNTQSLNPLNYGWQLNSEGQYQPIPFKTPIAPEALLNIICCNCSVEVEKPCHTNRCSCRKYGFQCLPACGRCHGVGCTNAPELQDDPEELES